MCVVERRLRKGTAPVLWLLGLLLLCPTAASAKQLGSDLGGIPDTGVCPTRQRGLETVCTESQLSLDEGHRAGEHLFSDRDGVITRWWVASGSASPATTAVRLRLRLLRDQRPSGATAFEQLPLAEPGVHRFSARLPIKWGDRLALDVGVRGSGEGVASAPIAHTGPGIGKVAEWLPPLGSAPRLATDRLGDTELMLSAGIENDYDRDGWGDSSQDRCRYDPRRHSPCLPDRTRPRIEVKYDHQQNFLAKHKVVVKVRANEYATVYSSGQIEFPNSTWGIVGSEKWVKPGEWATLSIWLEKRSHAAAQHLVEEGGHPYVAAYAGAQDASGNQRERWGLRIRLPRG